VIAAIVDRIPAVLDAVVGLARRIPEGNREMAIRTLGEFVAFATQLDAGGLKIALPSAPSAQLDALAASLTALIGKAREAASGIRSALGVAAAGPVDGLSYAETLRRVYGIEPAELLEWHREEVARCETSLHAVAASLDPSRDPYQILETDLGPYDSPDAMFDAMVRFVALARERACDYITLPDREMCNVWRVPEYLRGSYPWGGYFSFGSALAGQPRGAVFLNVYNYRTITRGWVVLNAIHECYPGHHAQFAKTAVGDMPLSFKVGTLTSRAAGSTLPSITFRTLRRRPSIST
jgi:uncharacterized protein (DUF885 family)